jgi:hypothetical protein
LLAKQCLEGVGGDPFAFSEVLAMVAATTFSAVTVCFFDFGLAPYSLKVFMPLTAFLFRNKPLRLTQADSQMSAKAKLLSGVLPPLGVCLPPSPV